MVPDRQDLRRLSRTVAHALRHAPWLYELEVDEEGWVPVDQLLDALRRKRRSWRDLSRADLATMVVASEKRRYELAGDRIRALYGHSLSGKLQKAPATPPDRLFHGTAPRSLPRIMETGLLPMNRQYVHLSTTREDAREVGRRKAEEPVVLEIKAHLAHDAGVRFYRGNDRVWLADCVPPRYVGTG